MQAELGDQQVVDVECTAGAVRLPAGAAKELAGGRILLVRPCHRGTEAVLKRILEQVPAQR